MVASKPKGRRSQPRSPWTAAADRLNPQPHPFVNDPVGWASSRIGAFIWSKQRMILESVRDHRYTAVKACFDSSKSFSASVLACWWLDVHPVGSAFVVTTAPTDPQVKAILWREIARRFDDADAQGEPLPGRVTMDAQWKINDALVAYGRKPADYNETAFQGIHDEYVLVILDEADGIPQSLWDAVDGLVTNEDSRVLAIGNPMDPTGPFSKACKVGSGWNTIQIAAWDTPNFTGEPVPEKLNRVLVSKTWVEERKKRWGIGSPRWVSKVEGDFPKLADDTLIEPMWIEQACNRILIPDEDDAALGVDVARFGHDETHIYLREGCVVRHRHVGRKDDTMVTAGWVHREIMGHKAAPIARIDDVGVGGGVTDRLKEQGLGVIGLNGGWAPTNKDEFGNARAEWYWNLRLIFDEGSIDLDPTDEDVLAQLVAIKYRLDSRGRIWVESKDEMRKRGLPSPDRADALCYAFVNMAALELGGHKPSYGLTGDLMTASW